MMTTEFEGYLNQAEQVTAAGEWQSGFDLLAKALEMDPKHTGVMTGLGTCLIQMGKPEEAVAYFENAAGVEPESVIAQNNLGVAYLLSGRLADAEQAYQVAHRLNPDDAQTSRNLAVVYLQQNKMEEGVQLLAALIKTNPKDADALFLLAKCYEEGEDITSAGLLYEEVLKIQPEHAGATIALAELQKVVSKPAPADPTRIAKPEHAKKLAALKNLRKSTPPAAGPASPEPAVAAETSGPLWAGIQSAAFYGPMDLGGYLRMEMLSQALGEQGLKTKCAEAPEPADQKDYDLLVFSQPNLSSELISAINACIQDNKRYAVDLDQDYHQIPQNHPAYAQFGPGNPRALKALEIMLGEAAWVSVPSAELADRCRKFARRVEVIPPMWNRGNRLWDKPTPRRKTLNVGWIGSAADREDLLSIKASLVKFLRAVPEAMLVVAGNAETYGDFNMLSETRRLYLPATSAEDIPYLLAQFDILIAPLQANAFNAACSDKALMEAGVRRIPWVASPPRAFREWGVGGILVENPGEWFEVLSKLANHADLRTELGEAGRQKAEEREVSNYKVA